MDCLFDMAVAHADGRPCAAGGHEDELSLYQRNELRGRQLALSSMHMELLAARSGR